MSFKRMVPSTAGELKGYLKQVHDNRKHVSSVKVNPANGHLEIDLDWLANRKYDDMYMPIKKGKINEAKLLVEKMMKESEAGYPPSDAEAEQLFDMIDHEAR